MTCSRVKLRISLKEFHLINLSYSCYIPFSLRQAEKKQWKYTEKQLKILIYDIIWMTPLLILHQRFMRKLRNNFQLKQICASIRSTMTTSTTIIMQMSQDHLKPGLKTSI